MFFSPIKPGITRWIICPSVSSVSNSSPRPWTGNWFPVLKVTVRVVRLENAEAVADGQAGCHDQKAASESSTSALPVRVDGLPGNDHCHDGGFTCAGGELQSKTHKLWVGGVVGVGEV